MENNGWIKIHRKFLEWEWYSDIVTKTVFIHLLITANHEKKQWLGRTIERGQVVIGLASLGETLQLSVQQIRTALGKLERTGEIVKKSTNKFTLITICKYDCYQQKEVSEQQTNNKPITNEQQTSNNKQEYKEYKERKNNINSSSMPDGTRPQLQEIISECKSKAYNVDPLQFFAYYEANGWLLKENKPMRNWRAALYQWNKKEKGNVMPHATTETMDLTNEHIKQKYEYKNAINYDEFLKRQQKS